jgi:hypothetical protein
VHHRRRGCGPGRDAGDVSEVPDGDALDDGVRGRKAEAITSAACTNACRSDGRKRLEKLLAVATSVTDVGVDALQVRTRGGCQEVRKGETWGRRPERRHGVT